MCVCVLCGSQSVSFKFPRVNERPLAFSVSWIADSLHGGEFTSWRLACVERLRLPPASVLSREVESYASATAGDSAVPTHAW